MVTSLDKNTALVLIDLQKGVVRLPVTHPIAAVLNQSVKLLAAFRKCKLPIVVVNVKPSGGWITSRKDAKQNTATLPPEFFELTPEIIIEPNDILITKHTWNAFYNTALDKELKKRSVTGIVLAGVATSIGVEGTGRAASEFAYNITFAGDAMTDMFADVHEHSVKRIFPRIGEVDTTDKIIALLDQLFQVPILAI